MGSGGVWGCGASGDKCILSPTTRSCQAVTMAGMDTTGSDDDIAATCARWVAACRAQADPVEGLRHAGRLWRHLEEALSETAAVRQEMIGRARAERSMNLTELADEVGLSKQRLQQIASRRKRSDTGSWSA